MATAYPLVSDPVIPATTDNDYLNFDQYAFANDADTRYVIHRVLTIPIPGTYLLMGTAYAEEFKGYLWQGEGNGLGMIGKRGSRLIDEITYEHMEGPQSISQVIEVTGQNDDNVIHFVAVQPRLAVTYSYAHIIAFG